MSKQILTNVIDPALKKLASHGIPVSDAARAMLYAIGLQESILRIRYQKTQSGEGKSHARGLWQFESGGGVAGVLGHKSTAAIAKHYANLHVGPTGSTVNQHAVWATLEFDDTLACIFARLLLYSDANPLPPPVAASQQAAWDYYIRNWRPGKPHADKWSANWKAALEAIA